jgi:putative transposase
MAMLACKFRLYPSRAIEETLESALNGCRIIYNEMLGRMNEAREHGTRLTEAETQRVAKELRKSGPAFRHVHSKVAQMVSRRLWASIRALAALKRHGKRVGRLRFKARDRFTSIEYNQSGFEIRPGSVWLSRIGEIKCITHRDLPGISRGVVIKHASDGKWWAAVQCKVPKREARAIIEPREVGIDVGVSVFAMDSDGNETANPKFMAKALPALRAAQKALSRKKRGSGRYRKARIKLSKLYSTIVDRRHDFLNKLSAWYVKTYDVICVEKLNIRGLAMKGRCKTLHRNIMDAAWGEFVRMLVYKASSAGKRVVLVDPRGTTTDCSRCGTPVPKQLWERVHSCPACHLVIDRDLNAALNILARGTGRAPTSVEERPLPASTAQHAVASEQAVPMKREAPPFTAG